MLRNVDYHNSLPSPASAVQRQTETRPSHNGNTSLVKRMDSDSSHDFLLKHKQLDVMFYSIKIIQMAIITCDGKGNRLRRSYFRSFQYSALTNTVVFFSSLAFESLSSLPWLSCRFLLFLSFPVAFFSSFPFLSLSSLPWLSCRSLLFFCFPVAFLSSFPLV